MKCKIPFVEFFDSFVFTHFNNDENNNKNK